MEVFIDGVLCYVIVLFIMLLLMVLCNYCCLVFWFGDVGFVFLGFLKKKWNIRWLVENVFLNIFIYSGLIYIGGYEFLLYEFYLWFWGYENILKIIVSFFIEFLILMIEY